MRSLILWLAAAGVALGQGAPEFTSVQRLTNREALLRLTVTKGQGYRIDSSSNLVSWQPMVTLVSTGANHLLDTRAPYLPARLYRAEQLEFKPVLTGDHLSTTNGEVILRPINHASFVLGWNGKAIYNDPVGGASAYLGLPKADLILISHGHGDHSSASTVDAVRAVGGVVLAPMAVYNNLSASAKAATTVLFNGGKTNVFGIEIEAIPAYNANHPFGVGNGYVITIGGRRVYMSGDTGNIPEMRALKDIDVAFVCMNVPFTMDLPNAVTAVRAFRPKVVYPYHYRNQDNTFTDLNQFKRQVGQDLGIEVRMRGWY